MDGEKSRVETPRRRNKGRKQRVTMNCFHRWHYQCNSLHSQPSDPMSPPSVYSPKTYKNTQRGEYQQPQLPNLNTSNKQEKKTLIYKAKKD